MPSIVETPATPALPLRTTSISTYSSPSSSSIQWEMVSSTVHRPEASSATTWPSAVHTSDRSDAALRESMARYSAAAYSLSNPTSVPPRSPQEELMDETAYMQARQHYEETFLRVREQAHHSLAELQQQRQRQGEYQLHQSQIDSQQQQRRSTRLPNQHRVYLINCKHCGHFLTDRGMKAVLLLRPHITLYSTDAIPNCGPLYPTEPTDASNPFEPVVERTCNCLTQTLGCYGCGAAVGYHIVSPCSRCTSSVAKHQRSSNGHRTVLHCAEISVRERRYIPGEKGVMTAAPASQPSTSAQTGSSRYSSSTYAQSGRSNDMFTRLDQYGGLDGDEQKETYLPYDDVLDPMVRRQPRTNSPPYASTSSDGRVSRVIKRGDNVYWSDLVEGGERAEPVDSDEILSMPLAGR